MQRREALAGIGLVAGAGLVMDAPALAKGVRRLTMVTDWPDGPGMMHSAQRLARTIEEASGGQIEIEVFPSGALVRPFETFDAVREGVADLFHTHVGYFGEKATTFQYFSGLPFGLTPNELFAWLQAGDGQALWDELGAQFGIKPLLCCNTGAQMGGWFTEAIRSIDDVRGLRYRMAGLGGEVFRRLGAAVVLLPAADIVPALRSGAIDACEWVGPWLDTQMGLHRVASHYYYPGWHEPGGAITLGINQAVWTSLQSSQQRLFEIAAAGEHARSLAEFDANNAQALHEIRREGKVELRPFEDTVLATLATVSAEVVAEVGAENALAQRIHASYTAFLGQADAWSGVGEGAYLVARARLLARR